MSSTHSHGAFKNVRVIRLNNFIEQKTKVLAFCRGINEHVIVAWLQNGHGRRGIKIVANQYENHHIDTKMTLWRSSQCKTQVQFLKRYFRQ